MATPCGQPVLVLSYFLLEIGDKLPESGVVVQSSGKLDLLYDLLALLGAS
jgi:hypothetical protein